MTTADPAELLAQAARDLAEARELLDRVTETLSELRIGERDGRTTAGEASQESPFRVG